MYRKKLSGRYFLSIVLLLFYFLSVRVGADFLVKPLENRYALPCVVNNDVILMLGNGSVADVPDFDGKGQPKGTMAKSMLSALKLYKKTGLPILVSGGCVYKDNGIEADIAIRNFSAMGVDKNKLYEENQSLNTIENARFSHKICNENGWRNPLLLVVAIQAPRTAMIFEKEGLKCVVFPTHFRRSESWHFHPVLDLIPDADNLADSAAAIKEYMGIVALNVFNYQ